MRRKAGVSLLDEVLDIEFAILLRRGHFLAEEIRGAWESGCRGEQRGIDEHNAEAVVEQGTKRRQG